MKKNYKNEQVWPDLSTTRDNNILKSIGSFYLFCVEM